MLTIRKIRVASDDSRAARRRAAYTLAYADSPEAFARADPGTSSAWLGSPGMLGRLGVTPDAPVLADQLALALQGRSVTTGERLRREGWIARNLVDDDGRPLFDADGKRRQVRVLGTKSVDLTVSAPKSVSVVWSQAGADVRRAIERAMVDAAAAMLRCMTETKPVVSYRRVLGPARGSAAAAAVHVTARTARGEATPSPQLHVHAVAVGVEREDGLFAAPELSGMFRFGAPLEGGAVARARLAEILVDMGFEIESETGPAGRFFEIEGVPAGLVDRMSARTKDVEAGIKEREARKGKALTDNERAVVALETRAPKSNAAPPDEIAARWRAHAEDFSFGSAEVEALRCGRGLRRSLDERHATVRAAARRRIATTAPGAPIGALRAAVLECAAGRLRLGEALALVGEMERSGALVPPAPSASSRPSQGDR